VRVFSRIEGKRLKRTRLVQGGRFVAAVDVEMVVPPDDPSEPCYEAETVELLRAVAEHAEREDKEWLQQRGKVYELIGSREDEPSA
jgi:hypothetical protein